MTNYHALDTSASEYTQSLDSSKLYDQMASFLLASVKEPAWPRSNACLAQFSDWDLQFMCLRFGACGAIGCSVHQLAIMFGMTQEDICKWEKRISLQVTQMFDKTEFGSAQ